jgi:uncharacterized membrane protein
MTQTKVTSAEYIDETLPQPIGSGSAFMNVGTSERVISALAGLALMNFGLRKFSFPRLLIAAAGAAFVERGVSGYCPVNNMIKRDTSQAAKPESTEITKSLTINRPRTEVYQFWRNFENLPKFMQHLSEVTQIDSKRSHWVAPVPGGIGKIEWDAEIIEEAENEKIVWRSVPNATVDNSGEILFKDAPAGQGTEIYVIIKYLPPAGAIGGAIAKVFNPAFKQMVKEDLRRFKRLIETGEIPVSESRPSGITPSTEDNSIDKIEKKYESPLL